MRQGRRLISPRVERFLHEIAQSYSNSGPRSLVNQKKAEEFTVSIEESVTAPSSPLAFAFLISKNVYVCVCVCESSEEMEKEKEKKKNKKMTDSFRFEISPGFYL